MIWQSTPCLHGEFCWHELNTRDADGSTAFYATLLNATATTIPMPHGDYTMLAIGSHTLMGIMPISAASPADVQAHWVGSIAVDDIELMTARAAELGATVRVPVMQGFYRALECDQRPNWRGMRTVPSRPRQDGRHE